jgi:hypothetical protein
MLHIHTMWQRSSVYTVLGFLHIIQFHNIHLLGSTQNQLLSARHESRRGLVSRCLCGRGKVGSAHALLMYSLPKNIVLSVSQFRYVEISCSFVSE